MFVNRLLIIHDWVCFTDWEMLSYPRASQFIWIKKYMYLLSVSIILHGKAALYIYSVAIHLLIF